MKYIKNFIKDPDNALLTLIAAMHIWALFAFNQPLLRKIFLPLTPLNLLLCSIVVIRSYRGSPLLIGLLTLTVYLTGFSIEVVGVNTGFPFGDYVYGRPLGLKVWDTPLIIGFNWFILFSGILYVIEFTKLSVLIKSLIGAGLMTVSDVVIEPVAIYLDFWSWKNVIPPSENYIGWFVVSLILFLIYYRFFKSVIVTQRSFWVVSIFVMFFIIQNIVI